MKASPLILLPGLLLACCLPAGSVCGDDAALRSAIRKGLGFITDKGDLWLEEKNCNACHHLPEMLWSHREARRRGFEVDPAKYAEWLAWAEPKVKNASAGLEGVAFMSLAFPEDMPAAAEALPLILKAQEADGSWKPAGQLGDSQRRSQEEARENATRLHLLALDRLAPAAAATARAKADQWVSRDTAPDSIEAHIFRALYAQRFSDNDRVRAICANLLKLQHQDGGWSWRIGEETSDALATGQVLHLLGGCTGNHELSAAADRARAWLIRTQRADGAWTIDPMLISKVDRSGEKKESSLKNVTDIYEFWGASWATIGLLQYVPVTVPAEAATER
jgi:hypothetical protein